MEYLKHCAVFRGTKKRSDKMAAPRNDNTKERVLSAALALLEEKSFKEISLAEVAKKAGISKGTLYYHYKTKNDVFLGLTDKYLQSQWDDLVKWTENKEKDTSLKRLVKYVVERNAASPQFRIQLYSEAQCGDEELRQKLIKRYADFERLISEKISERTDLPADFITWLLLIISDGIIIQSALGNKSFNKESFILETARLLGEAAGPAE